MGNTTALLGVMAAEEEAHGPSPVTHTFFHLGPLPISDTIFSASAIAVLTTVPPLSRL